MFIVDAHTHIFNKIKGMIRSSRIKSLSYGNICLDNEIIRYMQPLAKNISFPVEMLLEYMDWAEIDKAVLLQGIFYGDMNDYVKRAVQRWPKRFIGTAYIDPWSKNGHKKFKCVTEENVFKAVKIDFSTETGLLRLYKDVRLNDDQIEWFWRESARREIVITLDLGYVDTRSYQTEEILDILSNFSDLKIVIAHLGHPPIKQENNIQIMQKWEKQVLLALNPNVWLDMAALPAYVPDEDYPYPSACRLLQIAIELVGPEKIMWGSDIPGLLINATYHQLINFVTKHCNFLSQGDIAKIMGINALKVYGGG
ncbi:MAG: amidohydrolase [Actinobacteria bacterium]|nr:amidohydrolase [Actinomycetota bacterium]